MPATFEEPDEDADDPQMFEHKLIEPILPCRDPVGEKGVLSLHAHPAVRVAMAECLQLGGENDVRILHDVDVDEPVLELVGPETRLVLHTSNVMRYLVLFVKNLDAFFTFELELLDTKREYRTLTITNARSLARVNASHCQMPLALGKGWQYLCMDLQSIVLEAFGTQHVSTVQLRILATCRLLRVFFQDVRYSDAELPPDLSLLEGN
ncbi:hypothetical protein SDRG_06346 [Saprolegnia diclina VS20]|uniref:CFA20 domain-containing protein n=1 Tax=Saprolegnia diclina (strain VS20) TaxID=1156394 RepID=T0QEA9_SAPDV|nr:hypothetical protein SDRG_06346 [Saprolegnia diclina VS20]EQC36239.1 hypothetical protein SDRG_06346 [Saprolegnia diclina VS20]|eukprot:XP_008610345.1 hypothetical protein SDRG_06346 [Saprolegnia diclina VS20]